MNSCTWIDRQGVTIMIELTESEREALKNANGKVVRLVDPSTKQEYVLVQAEAFDELMAALNDDFSVRDAYPLINEVARKAGWDDPEWDSYDVYARKKLT